MAACTFHLCQWKRQLRVGQPHHQKASLANLIEADQRVAIQKEEDISQSRFALKCLSDARLSSEVR